MSQFASFMALGAFACLLAGNAVCAADDEETVAIAANPLARISARGQVVDPQGRPLPNARVVLRALSQRMDRAPGTPRAADILAEAITDEAGCFTFDATPLKASMRRIAELLDRGERAADVIAMADGFGLGWTPLYAFSTDDVTVVLQSAAVLEGTAVDEDDHPVAGATVEVVNISSLETTVVLGASLEDPDVLDLVLSSLRLSARTDEQGRFRMSGLPGDHSLDVWVRHPDFAETYFAAAVGEDASPRTLLISGETPDEISVRVNPVKVELIQGQRVIVHVVDEAGKPAGGGRLGLDSFWRATARVPANGTRSFTAPSPGDWRIVYLPPEGRPAVGLYHDVTLTDVNAVAPVEVTLRLPAARWMEGRVVAKGTEIGLSGLRVVWESTRKHGMGADRSGESAFSSAKTDRQGRFRIAARIGAGRVRVEGVAPGVFLLDPRLARRSEVEKCATPVDVPAVGDMAPLRLEASPGLVIEAEPTRYPHRT